MPLDPNIILQARGVELQNPLQQYGNALAIKNAQQQAQMNQTRMLREQAAFDEEQMSKNALRNFYGSKQSDEDLLGLAKASPAAYQGEVKRRLETEETRSKIRKDSASASKDESETRIKQTTQLAQLLRGTTNQQEYDLALELGTKIFGKTDAVPREYNPEVVKRMLDFTLSQAQVMQDQRAKEQNAVTMRGQDMSQATTIRGQNMTDARAREQLNFQREQSQNQFVPVDGVGLFVGDKRSGTARPVTDQTGQPIKAVKPAPQFVVEAIQSNVKATSAIDSAINLLETPQGKKALGLKNLAPGAVGREIINKMDPDGVETRAAVADIGSLEIKNRSGATVTIGEEPRLLPFIPTPTDSDETAKKKLIRLRDALKKDYEVLGEFYPDAVKKGRSAQERMSGGATGSWGDSSDPLGLRNGQ